MVWGFQFVVEVRQCGDVVCWVVVYQGSPCECVDTDFFPDEKSVDGALVRLEPRVLGAHE